MLEPNDYRLPDPHRQGNITATETAEAPAHEADLVAKSMPTKPMHQCNLIRDNDAFTAYTESVGYVRVDVMDENRQLPLAPVSLIVDAAGASEATELAHANRPTITVSQTPVPVADAALSAKSITTTPATVTKEATVGNHTAPSSAPVQHLLCTAANEEHSPTTEEYQECCTPDDFPMETASISTIADQPEAAQTTATPPNTTDDDADAASVSVPLSCTTNAEDSAAAAAAVSSTTSADADGIDDGGEALAPGCVAPAPTPAPSIAPLAEIEDNDDDDDEDADADAVVVGIDDDAINAGTINVGADGGATADADDDDEEAFCACRSVAVTPNVTPARMLDAAAAVLDASAVVSVDVLMQEVGNLSEAAAAAQSESVALPEARPGASVSRQQSLEKAPPNAVCPWEDE